MVAATKAVGGTKAAPVTNAAAAKKALAVRVRIIPTVLARTKEEFRERLARLLPVSKQLQVDFADGRFVPSTCVPLHELPDFHAYPRHTFEAHLMVEHPGAYIQPCARHGFKRVIVHIEALSHGTFENIRWQCTKHKLELVLAIKPETSVHKLVPYLHAVDGRVPIDGVLFMGVHPGFNGAPYVTQTPDHIRAFIDAAEHAGLADKVPVIQVDGGMTPMTIGGVVAAGARCINSGSFVANAPDPVVAVAQLQAAADLVVAKTVTTRVVTKRIATKKLAMKKSVTKKISTKTIATKKTTRSRRVSRRHELRSPAKVVRKKAASSKRSASRKKRR
jgi:ribulose-phosphate 3-epimerase